MLNPTRNSTNPFFHQAGRFCQNAPKEAGALPGRVLRAMQRGAAGLFRCTDAATLAFYGVFAGRPEILNREVIYG